MPNPFPTSRNYQPYTSDGTRVRSEDKQEERQLLQIAFEEIENGNLNDEAIDSRVIKDGAITLDKIDPIVQGLIGGAGTLVRVKPTISAAGQTVFTLPITPPIPADVICNALGLEQEYNVDYQVSGNTFTWLDNHFILEPGDYFMVSFALSNGIPGHTHDDRYYQKSELEDVLASAFLGDDDSYTNLSTLGDTIRDTLNAIDGALGLRGKLHVGSYAGDSSNDRLINAPFEPKFIIVLQSNGASSTFAIKLDSLAGKDTIIIDNASSVVENGVAIAIQSNGFTVDNFPSVNSTGASYHFIALG